MKIEDYFSRIGFTGRAAPDLATLTALNRLHPEAIAFEALDVQLQRPTTTDVEAAYDKLVTRRRGGWCYEMNGVFGWALEEIGFEVRRVPGGVMRAAVGDFALGNHLCLIVTLEGRDYLADVGFASSQTVPIAIAPSETDMPPLRMALTPLDDGYWRLEHTGPNAPFSFDFDPARGDEACLSEKCQWLQTHPDSPFVQNLVVQKRTGGAHVSLRGRVLSRIADGAEHKQLLHSPAELTDALQREFGLDVPEVAALWPAICARHAELFPEG